MTRPTLTKQLNAKSFCEFYYLKDELVAFCKANKLPTSGGKIDITNRIAHYLETGEVQSAKITSKRSTSPDTILETTPIEPNFVCSEKHRFYFKEKLGKGFSFNVTFQKWLKNNTGKTYADAIDAYYLILEEKKKGKTTIDKQFEYNTYIRDFFEHNKDLLLSDAIKCWKHKKSTPGHNRYEENDLQILKN